MPYTELDVHRHPLTKEICVLSLPFQGLRPNVRFACVFDPESDDSYDLWPVDNAICIDTMLYFTQGGGITLPLHACRAAGLQGWILSLGGEYYVV